MGLQVARSEDGHILTGAADAAGELANGFLAHLTTRNFSPATRRAYAFDLLNFLRFLMERRLGLADVAPTDMFDYLDWQQQPQKIPSGTVVRLTSRTGAAPATMNRRIAAVRSLYDYAVIAGAVKENPVPAARRSSGFRAMRRGLLGHLGKGRERGGGKLVREAKRLPFALDPAQVAEFIADLLTARDRSMSLLMLLGGLRASEVRLLPLANVDFGLRRVRVTGKGRKERVVPVDPSFFTELASYLRTERPAGCTASECFVVLRGPTTGHALTEAGLRRIFRTHRLRAGTPLVRPHRLRHTYGTELAAAGIDLLVLRDLMGHASPETTAGYVHLSATTLAEEYAAARSRLES